MINAISLDSLKKKTTFITKSKFYCKKKLIKNDGAFVQHLKKSENFSQHSQVVMETLKE